MSFGSLRQSFGNLGALGRTEIKIQEEAGCQSLSVEVHADTYGRDPNVLKPLQWCSLGSSERFVFISSCKCLLTGRSCCTIMIQCRAAERLLCAGLYLTTKVPLSGLRQVDPVCLWPKKCHLQVDSCPCPSLLSLTVTKFIKAGITAWPSSDTQCTLTRLIF